MGTIEIYNCNKCNFKFKNDYLNFFYDEKTQKTEDFMHVILNMYLYENSKIKGYIMKTYCPYCDKIIKTYIIHSISEDISKDSAIVKIKEGIEKDKKSSLVLYEKDVKDVINCPSCNKKINFEIKENSQCPKCENGKMILTELIAVD